MQRRFTLLLAALAVASSLNLSHAAEAPALLVTGNISNINLPSKKAHAFTLAELAKLGETEISSDTTYVGKAKFKGTLMRDILKAAGANANAKEVELVGLDGFMFSVPISDFKQMDVIAARYQNGVPLTIETKGPLWTMYPLDMKSTTNTSMLVWNLVKIRVK